MSQIQCFLLMCFIGSLQLTFMTLFSVAGFQVNLSHLSFVTLFVVFASRRFRDFSKIISSPWASSFVLLYTLYLVAAMLSVYTGFTRIEDLTLLVKYATYFAMFSGLFAILSSEAFSSRSIAVAVYGGCFFGICAFLIASTIILLRLGRIFPLEFLTALLRGDSHGLRFRVFLPIINYASTDIDKTSEAFVPVSLVNTMMGGMVLALQLVWIYRRPAIEYLTKYVALGLLAFVTLTSVLLVLGSTSRTNTIALIASVVVVSIGQFNAPSHKSQRSNIAAMFIICVALMLLAVAFVSPFMGIDDLVLDRFGSSVLADDGRISQYSDAIEKIKRRPFAGYGLGAKLHLRTEQKYSAQVHNLLLAGWYEVGISGLLTTLAFYGYLTVVWLCHIFKTEPYIQKDLRRLPSSVWFLSLPCVPWIRAMFAGQGGNFTLVEWVSLAFFFSIILRVCRSNSGSVSLERAQRIQSS